MSNSNNAYIEISDLSQNNKLKLLNEDKSDEFRRGLSYKVGLLIMYFILYYLFWSYTFSNEKLYSQNECVNLFSNSKSLCVCYAIIIAISLINLLCIFLSLYQKNDYFVLLQITTSYIAFGFEFIISLIYLFQFTYSLTYHEDCHSLKILVIVWLCLHYIILLMILTILFCYHVQRNYNIRIV